MEIRPTHRAINELANYRENDCIAPPFSRITVWSADEHVSRHLRVLFQIPPHNRLGSWGTRYWPAEPQTRGCYAD